MQAALKLRRTPSLPFSVSYLASRPVPTQSYAE
jgi:hypothetical protein